MEGYSTAAWATVFAAIIGASAALTGLLFVALSINLNQVIKGPGLIDRAIEVLVLLTGVLITSTLLSMPGQGSDGAAFEILSIAALLCILLAYIHIRAPRRQLGVSGFQFAMRVVGAQVGPVLLIVGGVSMLSQNGGGLYWVVPALVAAMVTAIIGAWVILVEIVR